MRKEAGWLSRTMTGRVVQRCTAAPRLRVQHFPLCVRSQQLDGPDVPPLGRHVQRLPTTAQTKHQTGSSE